MFQGWDNFFILTGSASATLVGLLFVSITLGAGLSTARGTVGTRVLLTPTVAHLGSVLFQCLAVVLVPWPSGRPAGILLGLSGLTGLIYQIHLERMRRKVNFAQMDGFDRALFSI